MHFIKCHSEFKNIDKIIRERTRLFANIYFSKVQKYKKTFSIYINFKIVTVQYLSSQNDFISLRERKRKVQASVPTKILNGFINCSCTVQSWV